MIKKRTVVIISLITTVVIASTLLQTDFFSTVHAPSPSEPDFVEIPEDNTVVTPEDEAVIVSPVTPDAPTKRCYVSGCSGELCSSEQGVMSACIFREEYACYQNATCEVQTTGECGWAQTAELNSCIANAKAEVAETPELAI